MSELEEREFELTPEQLEDLKVPFDEFDKDGNGTISIDELAALFKECGEDVPKYKIREYTDNMMAEFDKDKSATLDFDEFVELFKKLSTKFSGSAFRGYLTQRSGVKQTGGTSESSAEGTTHSYSKEEQVAFSDWINKSELEKDKDLARHLPIDVREDSVDLYEKVKDGILLCKVINLCAPGTIDERVINKTSLKVFTIHENQTLVINSAISIGCNVVNIGPGDLAEGKCHLVLGLLWQVIRIGLFSHITLSNVPGLARLLREGETIDDLHALSPEELLLRWLNYQLGKYYDSKNYPEDDSHRKQVKNFGEDIKDSEAYSILLYQVSPKACQVDPPQSYDTTSDLTKKAEKMLRNADKINCRKFVRAKDVVAGNQKLNMAFVANLFNTFPNLPELDSEESKEILEDLEEETREELTYRNWINSLGCKRYVNWIYKDVFDAIVILQLYDHIKPDTVNWKKVNNEDKCQKASMGGKIKCIENCNYAVELGQKNNFTVVGVQGSNINDGDKTLTLGLVWQMMRAYTYSMLERLAEEGAKPLTDTDIVKWVNDTLTSKKKTSAIRNMKDPSIQTSLPVLDLIDCIAPKMINPALIKSGDNDEEKLDNARYAISMARKVGAIIYALPEDLVEVKPKMVLTIFTGLKFVDMKKNGAKKGKGKGKK